MGFQKIYDYVPGKADWLAHALPSEGKKPMSRAPERVSATMF